jgi:hypothetical protein
MNTPADSPRGDFLATVVDRAQGRAALVAPRLPSAFEPVAGAADATAGDARETVDVPRNAGLRDDQEPAAPMPRVAREVRGDSPAPIARVHLPSRDASPPPALPPRRAEPPAALAALRVENATAAPAMPVAVSPEPASPTRDAVPMPRQAPAAPIRVSPAIAPVPTFRGNAVASSAVPPRPSPTLLPQRDLVASFAAMPAAARDTAAAPAAPVVTISIGRVDVRTTAAAPAPRATTPQRTPLRLADYLDRKERAR